MVADPGRSGEAPVGLSTGPDGVRYAIPRGAAIDAYFEEVSHRAVEARASGMEIVVVQGLGFVGSVMAAVVANASRADGSPHFLVIGVDRPTPDSYWKIGMLNAGRAPVTSEDPAVQEYVARAVSERRNLVASADDRVYSLADVVVVDIHLDVVGRVYETAAEVQVEMEPFRAAIAAIGRRIPPSALLLVETTVPPGTTEQVVVPTLREEFRARGYPQEPLVAHSYERVMPGRNYVRSIERFWRTFAGTTLAAGDLAERFLSRVVVTDDYPLCRLEDTNASELAKVLENSYRAANIAFIHEWTVAAESMGVNLFDVVRSIAVRRGTHDNMMRPGLGVGGYCLTKDGYLAQWGMRELFDLPVSLDFTLRALETNYRMPEHTAALLRLAMGDLRGRTVLISGVSYLADVADTRNSPSERLCDLLAEEGARVIVHDPYVTFWPERPNVEVVSLRDGMSRSDAMVLAVRHDAYLDLRAEDFPRRPGMVVLDTQNLLSDETADALHDAGLLPVGVGKGHWRRRYGVPPAVEEPTAAAEVRRWPTGNGVR